jgi:hypothetical protein
MVHTRAMRTLNLMITPMPVSLLSRRRPPKRTTLTAVNLLRRSGQPPCTSTQWPTRARS